ncbi:uncharacterized protein LOC132732433 [Ruditapes philippinarum]|uniref:uncharacterized protein LOC132732433 n=1 Tax=Ruditapes philippinarum TaxID=129788 RepID=UPI00295B657E|nr:uncharacterized protein LOC132732433 [Ruditapes philippinarum]
MSQESDVKKRKFRNWVRGGLAYKYLKQGLEGFADDVVKQDHKRILSANYTSGIICTRCIIGNLKPTHACIINSAGKNDCYWGQHKCNCLRTKKEVCRLHICDHIMEEVLKSHGSTPPTPNWANTDIQKWCTEPWEVAKCFINAPGYSDKTKAADIDISGILHVVINDTNFHSHLSCSMTGTNLFIKVRERRNKLFHSPTMEIEDTELAECIDDVIEILEDPKELKGIPEARQAVNKLKQLKQSDFVITTHNEVEVCREALASVNLKSEEIEQAIQDAKNFISDEQKEMVKCLQHATSKQKQEFQDVSDQAKETIQKGLLEAIKVFDRHSEILYERVKKLETGVSGRVEKLETDVSERVGILETDVSERVGKLETDVLSLQERVSSLEGKKKKELDGVHQMYMRRYDYVKRKQELQDNLVRNYQKYYVNTSLSPLKQEEDSTNVIDVYVPPEIEVIEVYQSVNIDKDRTKKIHEIGYHENVQTKGQRYKKIYILGDVGTGKTTFCKMMIENWCDAVTGVTKKSKRTETLSCGIKDDVIQVGHYEFLFFIQLQYMSAFKSDATVDMIKELTKDLTLNTELIDRIFQEESERCLIIVDSLDEWRPSKISLHIPHVSYGIPNGDRAQDATVITLSRPSAKGILNLKKSEIDLKLQLVGIPRNSLKSFIERYISESTGTNKSCNEFMSVCTSKHIDHVEKTPLLLQQLLWLYCNGIELGNSVSETYCHIFNTMYGWSDHKKKGHDNDASQFQEDCKTIHLPAILQRFPRLKKNNHVLFRLGRIAYETITSDIEATCGLTCRIKKDLSDSVIDELTQFGILNESTCYDRTLEDTQLAFIHISYLEFFAALYVTTSYNMEQTASVKQSPREVLVLDELFGICKSASDVLQLSNVIKMICGLSPVIVTDLSKQISCIVNKDKHILHLRQNRFIKRCDDEINLIQNLMLDCLKECGSDDKTMISLSNLDLVDFINFPLQSINPGDVISLTLGFNPAVKIVLEYITNCINMQYMHVSDANPFQLDNPENCSVINLSKHKQLRVLKLSHCNNFKMSALNTEQLEQVHIKECPDVLELNLLSNASTLTELCLENFSCDLTSLSSVLQQVQLRQLTLYHVRCNKGKHHNIDLSGHKHLKTLRLVECPDIIVTGINTDKLEQVYIHKYFHALDMNLLHNASKSMELYIKGHAGSSNKAIQKSLLQQTTLELTNNDVKGYKEEHIDIDLSRQNHLQKLKFVKCPNLIITGLNTEKLEQICIEEIEGCFFSDIRNLYLQPVTSKLTELHLKKVTVNVASLVLIIQQAPLRQLTLIHVSDDQALDGHVHVMYLTKQNQLRELMVKHCGQIQISNINNEQLVHVYINDSSLDFYLSVPPSTTSKLIEIHLEKLTCNKASLISLLQQTTLRELILTHVCVHQCDDEGFMHVTHVDLSKHSRLQILNLSYCKNIRISGLNTENLESIHISAGILDFDLLSNASRLTELILQDNYVGRFQYSRQVGNVVHTLHQLRNLTLLNVDVEDNALTVTPEMSVTHIKLDNALMSMDTWRSFVDSLLTLGQFVEVVTVHINEGVKELYDYILTHPTFVVICESKLRLIVRSDRPRRIYHFL